ncbi:hypothetical protein HN51_013206 [Arachis hypogaea]
MKGHMRAMQSLHVFLLMIIVIVEGQVHSAEPCYNECVKECEANPYGQDFCQEKCCPPHSSFEKCTRNCVHISHGGVYGKRSWDLCQKKCKTLLNL